MLFAIVISYITHSITFLIFSVDHLFFLIFLRFCFFVVVFPYLLPTAPPAIAFLSVKTPAGTETIERLCEKEETAHNQFNMKQTR